mgnify:FL=1
MTEMQLKTLQSGQVRHERDRGEAVHRLSAEPAAPEAGQELSQTAAKTSVNRA